MAFPIYYIDKLFAFCDDESLLLKSAQTHFSPHENNIRNDQEGIRGKPPKKMMDLCDDGGTKEFHLSLFLLVQKPQQ